MLIKVFGIWLLASNINWLEQGSHLDSSPECIVHFNQSTYAASPLRYNNNCEIIAVEINKQLKDVHGQS